MNEFKIPTLGLDRTVHDLGSILAEQVEESRRAVNKFKRDLESGRFQGQRVEVHDSGYLYLQDLVIKSLSGHYCRRQKSHMRKLEEAAKFIPIVTERETLEEKDKRLINDVEFDLSAVLFNDLNHSLGSALHHNCASPNDISKDLILVYVFNSYLVRLIARKDAARKDSQLELELLRPSSFMESFYGPDIKSIDQTLRILKTVYCPQLDFRQPSYNLADTSISSEAFRSTYRAVIESKNKRSSE